jgi:alpha/beta superfamily hydrolase
MPRLCDPEPWDGLPIRPTAAIVNEDARFPVGPYLLHGELAYPEANFARGAVVFAGPHPLLGGNMRNNVVRSLGDGLAQRGLITLRFDYRGVGRSEGPQVDVARHLAEFWQTSHAPGEMDFGQDVQGAVDFVQRASPGLPMALVGYSFGCALLPYIRPHHQDVAALVLIAPTVAKHNYDSFRSVTSPLLVVTSDDDFATEAQHLDDWFGTLAMPRQLVRQRCDNHFFRGHEDWLVETVGQFLDGHWRDEE